LSDVKHIARTARGLQRSTSFKGVCQSTNYSTWVCVCTSKASCDTRPNVKDIHEKHHISRPGYDVHEQFKTRICTRSWSVIPIELPNRPEGPEEYEFYEREGFERWSGTWCSFSRKRGVKRPRSAKMRPYEDTRKMTVKEEHEHGS
jgi:hypothetical protein